MSKLKNAIKTWEQEKKDQLVELGKSRKSYPKIIQYMENEIANSKRMVNLDYSITCFKNDGIYQLNRAIENVIGVSSIVKNEGASGGETPPNTIDIVVGEVRKKVLYGDINLPDMGEGASISIGYDLDDRKLYVRGTCQLRFQAIMDEITDLTKQLLATESIYRGQALEISNNDNGQPTLMNLSNIDKEFMILSKEQEYEVAPILTRIEQTELCIREGIPIKLGCLFFGNYGTGKTLIAFKLAKKAIDNNWVFIYLKEPTMLAQTLRMCKSMDKSSKGVLVFLEDVDQIVKGERDAVMQDILNTLDGGDSKDLNVISLFTTNHLEKINPTFLRGKRIGNIIEFGHVDKETAMHYFNHSFGEGKVEGDLEAVCREIERRQIVPAFLVEIIDRVKANRVFLNTEVVTDLHIMACIKSYIRQMEIAKVRNETLPDEVIMMNAFKRVVQNKDQVLIEDLVEVAEEDAN